MAICDQDVEYSAMELPSEFEDLAGLLHTDLQAIVGMVTERAHERLFLTRREHSQLQAELWNRLTDALNQTLEPLTAENR
jgi:hypothetical protein